MSEKKKNKYRFWFLSLLFFPALQAPLTAQPAPVIADSVTYLWPTDASRQLSSTFAETRSAHLHAGLDIRTWGQEGYRVFATRDGIAHRIGMSPYGYGNVLYLKHHDGSFSVYAHMNRFESRLQAFADSIRLADKTAQINRIVEEKGFYFRQGEVIGYTGSTGAGPPHLHFELRTPDFDPVNPLLTNLRVQDTIPPVFRGLGIEFLKPGSLRPDGYEIVNPKRTSDGYDFGEISIHGPVGLSVNVHDRANGTPNVYAVYTLTMMHESDTLFHSRADFFPDNHANHMFLDRSHTILADTWQAFQRLYMVDGNKLPFYRPVKGRGVLNLPDGSYPLRIIASDIFGNRTEARVLIHSKGNTAPHREITHVPPYPDLTYTIHSPVHNWKKFQLDSGMPLLVSVQDNSVPFHRINTPIYIGSSDFVEKKLFPGKKNTLHTPNQKLWINLPEEALHDTLHVRMQVEEREHEISVHFEPRNIPLGAPVELNYILPEHLKGNSRLVLYSVDENRNRRYFRPSTLENGIIRSSLREINNLLITEDHSPPWVGNPYFDRNLAGKIVISVPASDRETGIDLGRSRILVNGTEAITDYNPDKNRLIYYHPDFTPSGQNRVEIVVFDRAGNQTTKEVSLPYSR